MDTSRKCPLVVDGLSNEEKKNESKIRMIKFKSGFSFCLTRTNNLLAHAVDFDGHRKLQKLEKSEGIAIRTGKPCQRIIAANTK